VALKATFANNLFIATHCFGCNSSSNWHIKMRSGTAQTQLQFFRPAARRIMYFCVLGLPETQNKQRYHNQIYISLGSQMLSFVIQNMLL